MFLVLITAAVAALNLFLGLVGLVETVRALSFAMALF